jgi:regulator of protease activity HflC (stomatin/prohibitin superfamily)
MQNVKLAVRILFHPEVDKLQEIYTHLGLDYDTKVLPAIVNEITRSALAERANIFWIRIDNLAITELTFGKEYLEAIEGKQVAQQEAERAKYEVDQAKEHKKSIIIKA